MDEQDNSLQWEDGVGIERDPVHQHTEDYGCWDSKADGKWYFYDETGANEHGPYDTEEEANHQLNLYTGWLNRGADMDQGTGPDAYPRIIYGADGRPVDVG